MVERAPRVRPRFGSLAGTLTALAVLVSSVSTSARADAVVKGTIEAVEIEARDSSVAEVLTALSGSFGLQYRSLTPLNRPVTGSFRGTLFSVISVLLKNYDHVVKRSAADLIEVTVIRFREPDAYPAPRPPPQAAPASARGSDRLMPPPTAAYPHPPPKLFQSPHPPRP